MAGIFDENNMMQVLNSCIPEGETLQASVKGVTLQVNKKKTSFFDVYIGITQRYLLVVECEERKYLNAFYHIPDLRKTVAEDAGTCFPFTEIQSCVIKNAIMGAVNCSVTLKNGSFLKLQIPKRGGRNLPRQGEYRDKILDCLKRYE